MAQDFKNGIAPDVLAERAPHAGLPKREKEALRIFENLDAVLRAAGTDRSNLVRTDQYYTTVKAVPPYQQVRREFLAGRIPPSTSIAQQGLLLPGADMNIQALGVIPQPGLRGRRIIKHEALAGRPTSGYSPALTRRRLHLHSRHHLARGRRRAAAQRRRRGRADDRGRAMGRPCRSSSRPSSSSRERMVQSLALAGATLEDVVHAQVYLTDRDDYSAFNEAWTRHFAKSPPTLDIIPCIEHGLAPYDGKIEINVLALKPGGAAKRRAIDAGVPTAFRQSAAGDQSRRSPVHVGPDGVRRQRARAVGRRRSAPAAVLVVGGGAGRIHHRQHRQALRSRRHVARQCRARAAIPHRHRASSIRSTRSGSAGSAAGRCRSPRSRCPRRCRCRARPC